jgi:hypothetical protein
MFVILSGTVNVTRTLAVHDAEPRSADELSALSLEPALSFAAFKPHRSRTNRPRRRAHVGMSRLMAGQLLGEAAAFDGCAPSVIPRRDAAMVANRGEGFEHRGREKSPIQRGTTPTLSPRM